MSEAAGIPVAIELLLERETVLVNGVVLGVTLGALRGVPDDGELVPAIRTSFGWTFLLPWAEARAMHETLGRLLTLTQDGEPHVAPEPATEPKAAPPEDEPQPVAAMRLRKLLPHG